MASGARSRSFLTIDAVGTREMVRAFERLGRDGIQQQIIGPGLAESAELVADVARRKAPVRTGALRESIDTKVSKTRARIRVGRTGHGAGAPYARFLEFGTKNAPAQPFMRPALDESRRRIEVIFGRYMQQALERIAKGGNVLTTGGRGRFRGSKAA